MEAKAKRPSVPLIELLGSPRATKALELLGIETVQDFLRAPRQRVLSVPGVESKHYRALVKAAQRGVQPLQDPSLLPARLTDCPTDRLPVDEELRRQLNERGLITVGDLLRSDELVGLLGERAHARLHDALDTVLQHGTDWAHGLSGVRTLAEIEAQLCADLEPDERTLLRERLGLAGPPIGVHALAHARQISARHMEHQLEALRLRVVGRAARITHLLRVQALDEMAAWSGFVTRERLTQGTLLDTCARDGHDPLLPFRVLCFCYPTEFHLCGHALVRTPLADVRRARRLLRALTRPVLLPMAIGDLEHLLADAGVRIDRGFLLHLLARRRRLRVVQEPDRGEVVALPPDALADRLFALLGSQSMPQSARQLCALHRDAHGGVRRSRVLARLRADSRFAEVGDDQWDLYERCSEDLLRLAPRADDASSTLRATGRCHVREVVPQRTTKGRDLFLVAALLRRDPRLRDLGRGEFCPRDQELPPFVASVERSLRQAMGEIPLSRFVENYPEARRPRVLRLLGQNRLFLYPGEDRVDLCSNYPFSRRRLNELRRVVNAELQGGGGSARIEDVLAAVHASSLASAFVTGAMLCDVLRRYGPYDHDETHVRYSADAADSSQALAARLLAALRQAARPLTVEELAAADPDLAPHRDALAEIMTVCEDISQRGEHFVYERRAEP